MELLTRTEFREKVFLRDNHKCVICGNLSKDAHHIMERRLFNDEGYYLDNGASLCALHHIAAEETILSTEEIRQAAKIEKIVLPDHLYRDEKYDKWGNIILSSGSRIKGELFFDESVQKILKPVLSSFIEYVKYPRTYHLPWSESRTKDDRILDSCDIFKNKEVIVSIKMDGENTSLYHDYIHARSIDSDNHISRSWVKNFHSTIMQDIPKGYRICGENLFAKHAIHYHSLKSYFLGFSIWNNFNECFDWNSTLEWFSLLSIDPVPVIYCGLFDEDKIKDSFENYKKQSKDEVEGYVIRNSCCFPYSQFRSNVAKFVRKNHIQDVVHHWKFQKILKNERLFL